MDNMEHTAASLGGIGVVMDEVNAVAVAIAVAGESTASLAVSA